MAKIDQRCRRPGGTEKQGDAVEHFPYREKVSCRFGLGLLAGLGTWREKSGGAWLFDLMAWRGSSILAGHRDLECGAATVYISTRDDVQGLLVPKYFFTRHTTC